MIGIKKRDALTNTTHKTLTKRDFAKFNIGRNFALKFSKKKSKKIYRKKIQQTKQKSKRTQNRTHVRILVHTNVVMCRFFGLT